MSLNKTFRNGQATVIDKVLRGAAVLAVLPTGAGKSLTYQLPALLLPGATLVGHRALRSPRELLLPAGGGQEKPR